MNKTEKIMEIAKEADDSDRIIVFTTSFKVVGKLLKKSDMISRGILTLTNATVCNALENFECSFSHHIYDWLNIFEEQITAFSITTEECLLANEDQN